MGQNNISSSAGEATGTPAMCSVKQQDNPNLAHGVETMPIKPPVKATSPRCTLRIIRKKRRRVDDAPATAKN